MTPVSILSRFLRQLRNRSEAPATATTTPDQAPTEPQQSLLAEAIAQRDRFRHQRDQAREQRDAARTQRDVARTQRDDARTFLEELRAPQSFSFQELERCLEGNGTHGQLPPYVDPNSPFARALLEGRYVRPWFIHHTDYDPPPPGLMFACVCNDKYLSGLEALILSLTRVYPGLDNRFLVLHDHTLSQFSRDRLHNLYPGFEFQRSNTDKYTVSLGDAYNHQRVGRLGYLTLDVLAVEDAERVLLLDADLIILGDISPLWQGDDVNVVADIGIRPFGVVSEATDRPIMNSGVISLPRAELGTEAAQRASQTLRDLDECGCEILSLYADQKFWNLHLAKSRVRYLPNTFNANKALVEKYYPEQLAHISVLHITGAKPWYEFTNEQLVTEADRTEYRRARSRYTRTFTIWHSTYQRGLAASRLASYRQVMGPTLKALADSQQGRPCLLIGNGPSLAATDMDVFNGFVKVAFNWFVNHDDFDRVAPDHLVLASHMFFGGWHTSRPSFPDGFLDALHGHDHRPSIWVSFYFREFIERSRALSSYPVNYVLYEKPFKARLDHLGRPRLDLTSFLADAHTGVLTAGVPLAVHLGCNPIVLVGCDSNYSQNPSGDYFYHTSNHTSPTTNLESLTNSWLPDGPGPYSYRLTYEALRDKRIDFFDATIGGTLRVLPRIGLGEAAELMEARIQPDKSDRVVRE